MNLATSALKLPLNMFIFIIYYIYNAITYLYFLQVSLEKFNHIIIKFDLHKYIFSICITVHLKSVSFSCLFRYFIYLRKSNEDE